MVFTRRAVRRRAGRDLRNRGSGVWRGEVRHLRRTHQSAVTCGAPPLTSAGKSTNLLKAMDMTRSIPLEAELSRQLSNVSRMMVAAS